MRTKISYPHPTILASRRGRAYFRADMPRCSRRVCGQAARWGYRSLPGRRRLRWILCLAVRWNRTAVPTRGAWTRRGGCRFPEGRLQSGITLPEIDLYADGVGCCNAGLRIGVWGLSGERSREQKQGYEQQRERKEPFRQPAVQAGGCHGKSGRCAKFFIACLSNFNIWRLIFDKSGLQGTRQ